MLPLLVIAASLRFAWPTGAEGQDVEVSLSGSRRSTAIDSGVAHAVPTSTSRARAIEPPAGADLLPAAIERLRSYRSLRATLRQQISLFGHTLVGSGEYYQMTQGRDLLLRMDLKIQLEDRASVFQQISDGRFLWRYSHRPSIDELGSFQREMSRVDLDVVKSAMPLRPSAPSIDLAFGGLPHLLAQLNQNFQFDSALSGTLHGVPVWMSSGGWQPDALARLAPEQAADEPPQERVLLGLAEQIPHSVTIHFGKDDLFPYRVEFWRITSDKPSNGIVVSANSRRTVVLELFEVQFNIPIDVSKFERSSFELPVVDATSAYLRDHGLTLGSP